MSVKSIDAKTAHDWLAEGEAILIDVREPKEYDAMHIPGATLLPLGSLTATALPAVGDKKIIIHCQLGKRGSMACEKLLNTPEVYNLEGGIMAWAHAGFEVSK